MKELEKEIIKQIKEDHEYVVSSRRYLHSHPELSKKEYNTALYIEQELDKLGIKHTRVGETGVIGEIKGDLLGNKTILLRADTDALPIDEVSDKEYKSIYKNVHHACGHDAHTASLLGAIRILVKNKDKFGGTIKFHFQPGEEVGFGARDFINKGVLKKGEADRSFGLHLASNLEVGKIAVVSGPNNASVDWFRINVHGKGCHVSTPEKGVDSAYVAAQILISIQSLITRKQNPMQNVLIGVGKLNAGVAYNVVAEEASLEGTIRALNETVRENVKHDLEKLATLTSEIYGATVDFEWNDNTSALINDEESSIEVQKVCSRIFGEDKLITKREASLGGDDFAEYIKLIKGCYAYVGSRNESRSETCVAHHDCHFDIDEDCLYNSVEILSLYAIEYLNNDLD